MDEPSIPPSQGPALDPTRNADFAERVRELEAGLKVANDARRFAEKRFRSLVVFLIVALVVVTVATVTSLIRDPIPAIGKLIP